MKIVCAESVLCAEQIFSHLGQIDIIPDTKISQTDLKHADVLITRSKTTVNSHLLAGTKVQFVGTATAGFDHLDTSYLNQQNIAWHSAAGCNANSVAEYVIAALLELEVTRSINLLNKSIAIIGAGAVGQCLSLKAKALGMEVLLNDPPLFTQTQDKDLLPLDEVLARADIVSLHVPLTREGAYPTYQMVNNKFLSKLKPGCILINTSRGEVINEQTLDYFLHTGRLGPLILDVWDNEPEINQSILLGTAIATPHIAGYSMDGRINGSLQIYHKLCEAFSVTPRWRLEDLFPQAKQPTQILRCEDEDTSTLLWRMVSQAYDIKHDQSNLFALFDLEQNQRADHFQHLRKNYAERWEFQHYPVTMINANEELKNIFRGLGFKLIA